jgi:hypothetical protein
MEGYKLFAQLCEAYVTEVSSTVDLVKKHPGGPAVVQKLHQSNGLPHDQAYAPIPKIMWDDIKGPRHGTWIIITGPKGTGAIRATGSGSSNTYHAFASDGGEVQALSDSRGGNVRDFVKGIIGNFQKYYAGQGTSAVKDKKKERSDRKVGSTAFNNVTQDTLITKFKPLWQKSMDAAIADIKGMAQTMIKNDSFEKASKKIELLKTLEVSSEALQSGDTVPGIIKRAVQIGIMMAASHHYPEETGDITKNYGGYNSQRSEGSAHLLKDISNGDVAKLGTVLGFFKRSLISS